MSDSHYKLFIKKKAWLYTVTMHVQLFVLQLFAIPHVRVVGHVHNLATVLVSLDGKDGFVRQVIIIVDTIYNFISMCLYKPLCTSVYIDSL